MGPSVFESSATVEPAPRPVDLEALRVALAVTENATGQHPSWLTNQQWNSAVNETLEAAGETLDHYYWCGNFKSNEHLPEVRQIARSILISAMDHPENHRRFWFGTNSPPAAELDAFYKSPNVFQTAATFSGVFNETPEEAASAYRQLMNGSAFPYVREFLFGRHVKTPRLPAWRRADEGRLKKVWNGFIDRDACVHERNAEDRREFFSFGDAAGFARVANEGLQFSERNDEGHQWTQSLRHSAALS